MANELLQSQQVSGRATLENWQQDLPLVPSSDQQKLADIVIYYPAAPVGIVPKIENGSVVLTQASTGGNKVYRIPYDRIVAGSIKLKNATTAVKGKYRMQIASSLSTNQVGFQIEIPQTQYQTPERFRSYYRYVRDLTTYNAEDIIDDLVAKVNADPYAPFVAAKDGTNAITLEDKTTTDTFRIVSQENLGAPTTVTARVVDSYKWKNFSAAALPADIFAAETNPNKSLRGIEFKAWAHHRQTDVLGGGSNAASDNATYIWKKVSYAIIFDPAVTESATAATTLSDILTMTSATTIAQVKAYIQKVTTL